MRRYTPAGRVDRDIAVPAKNPTCVAFGGSNLDELYITSSRQEMSDGELAATPHAGGVYRALPGVAGLADALFNDSLIPKGATDYRSDQRFALICVYLALDGAI